MSAVYRRLIPMPYLTNISHEHKISYTIIKFNESNIDNIIDEIATTINVKLYDNHNYILFVAPIGFENWKSEDKLLLYGTSGCGKSRNVIEIVKGDLNSIRNIYIINSKNE